MKVLNSVKSLKPFFVNRFKFRGDKIMKVKRFLSLSLVLLMTASSLAGCSNTKQEANPKANTRKENNELVVAVGSEPEGLDPTTGGHHAVTRVFFSTLLKRDKDLNIQNDLATEDRKSVV